VGLDDYERRIKKYVPFQTVIVADIKDTGSLAIRERSSREGERVLQRLQQRDYLILLDEKGKEYSSSQFAQFLEKELLKSHKKLIFLIGGAFGFSDALLERADLKISLSKMTFSHQMVRLFLLEQLYRGFAILHNEPYHNA
jgi:23S rRNA (pseudouridine1915-N3)-methyltransferase